MSTHAVLSSSVTAYLEGLSQFLEKGPYGSFNDTSPIPSVHPEHLLWGHSAINFAASSFFLTVTRTSPGGTTGYAQEHVSKRSSLRCSHRQHFQYTVIVQDQLWPSCMKLNEYERGTKKKLCDRLGMCTGDIGVIRIVFWKSVLMSWWSLNIFGENLYL